MLFIITGFKTNENRGCQCTENQLVVYMVTIYRVEGMYNQGM